MSTPLPCDPDWECPRHRHAGLVDCADCGASWCRECVCDPTGYWTCPADGCGVDVGPVECECGDPDVCLECRARYLDHVREREAEHIRAFGVVSMGDDGEAAA